mmetsp:Transcript_57772/g.154398  ORF Transcript_57772/g.154398 Transcript_57772/m.154398 type:complete len:204 (+) Transcript_57772:994-1605(+)
MDEAFGVQPGHGEHDLPGDLANALGGQRGVPLVPQLQPVLQGALGQLGHDVHAAVHVVRGRLPVGILGEIQEFQEEVGRVGAGQLLAPERLLRGPLQGPLQLLQHADLALELGERGRPLPGGLVHLDRHGIPSLHVAAKVAHARRALAQQSFVPLRKGKPAQYALPGPLGSHRRGRHPGIRLRACSGTLRRRPRACWSRLITF